MVQFDFCVKTRLQSQLSLCDLSTVSNNHMWLFVPGMFAKCVTHIFLSWGNFLKIPVASSTVNSLLFRRLRTEKRRGGQRQKERTTEQTETEEEEGGDRGWSKVSSLPHTDRLCSRKLQHDSQFGGVLGDVIWYFGEFLVGAVHRGALTAALLWAGQVGEAVPSKLTAVIFSTWSQSQSQRHRVPSSCKSRIPACTGMFQHKHSAWLEWQLWYKGRISKQCGGAKLLLFSKLSKRSKHVQKTLAFISVCNIPHELLYTSKHCSCIKTKTEPRLQNTHTENTCHTRFHTNVVSFYSPIRLQSNC